MKRKLLTFLLLTFAVSGWSQGTVQFNNRFTNYNIYAPVYGPEISDASLTKTGNTPSGMPAGNQSYSGVLLTGSGWSAQLFAAPGANASEDVLLEALTPMTTFRTGPAAGCVAMTTARLAGVPDDSPVATIQMRAWNNQGGTITNWAAAQSAWQAGTIAVGKSLLINVTNIGGTFNTPPLLDGIQSFNVAMVAGAGTTITANPNNQSVCAGSPASFAVTAGGSSLTYQWQVAPAGGAFGNLVNATNSFIVIPAAALSESGNQYRCVVSGASGTATSTAATLVVFARPGAMVSGSTQICPGGAAVLQASLSGVAPWVVRWSDGYVQSGVTVSPVTRIVAPTSSTNFMLTGLSDARCTAQPVDLSGTAAITVTGAPVIGSQPTNLILCAGSVAMFSVTNITGAATLSYQWQFAATNLADGITPAGSVIAGATNAVLYVTNVTAADALSGSAGYRCLVSGDCGLMTTSSVAGLSLNSRPLAVVSGGGGLCSGSSVSITNTMSGVPPFNFAWSDGVIMTGVTSNQVRRVVSAAGVYTVTSLSDARCVATAAELSGAAVVALNPRPTSLVSGSTTVCAGSVAVVQAALSGVAPFALTWSDGVSQSGISSNVVLRSVAPLSNTVYAITALSDANCISLAGDRSGSASITVSVAPTITQSPQTLTANTGSNVTFSVTATGTATLSYQWRKGGMNLIGATNSSLLLSAVTTNSAGTYDVIVANGCGTAVSAAAVLTVNPPASCTLPLPWLTVDVGAVGLPGSACESGGAYSVKGAGAGISGTADQFRYVYQTLSGDGSIVARVTSQTGTTTASLVGVMIRETTNSNSRFALMVRQGSGNKNMLSRYRASTGGAVTSTTGTSLTPPNCWVKLTRTGSTFNMLRSSDGVNWTSVKSASITMASQITVGIIVTSGSNSILDTDGFDSVTVVP